MDQHALTLGGFLRAKRAAIAPERANGNFGLHRRRRVTGLRREEVAHLAGISITWYTLLEQDRADSHPSRDVLASIARVLKLTPVEQVHLYNLAHQPAPPLPIDEHVTPALHRLIAQQPSPALLVGRYWDILTWNTAASALFGDYADTPVAERNLLYQAFINPAVRTLIADWEHHAQQMVAALRADYGHTLEDPRYATLVAVLHAASPEFRAWWLRSDITRCAQIAKTFVHPEAGPLHFDQTSLSVGHDLSLRLVIYVPADEESQERLMNLLAAQQRLTEVA